MQLKLFSIRDQKGECFSPPFLCKTNGEAERSLHDHVKNPESRISKHPTDYDLYQLGTYCDTTGKIEPLSAPQHVVSAMQFLNQ